MIEASVTFKAERKKVKRHTRSQLHKLHTAERKAKRALTKAQARLDAATARRTGKDLAVFEGWVEKTKSGTLVRHPGVSPWQLERLLGEVV